MAHAGKGFGSTKDAGVKEHRKKGKVEIQDVVKIDGSAGMDKAVQQALKAAASSPSVRPVDPAEAASGRLDVVQVKSWGSGEPSSLGDLQVVSHKQRMAPGEAALPLYQRLARSLEMAQAQGALGLATGARPPPPFERWSFTRRRYLEYLAGAAAVHAALEAALQAALTGGGSGGGGGAASGAAQALQSFGLACDGLARSSQFTRDLEALHHQQQQQQQQQVAGQQLPPAIPRAATGGPVARTPQSSVAYAAYLARLGSLAAGEGGAGSGEADSGRLRLLCNAYCVHVSHLSGGTRIGSAAVEKLGILGAGACAAFQEYPQGVGDPLERLRSGVDGAGAFLSEEEVALLLQELPRAFQKSSLLLACLAHED